jgi:hypothetical protein
VAVVFEKLVIAILLTQNEVLLTQNFTGFFARKKYFYYHNWMHPVKYLHLPEKDWR